jgi:hypothetical protein
VELLTAVKTKPPFPSFLEHLNAARPFALIRRS